MKQNVPYKPLSSHALSRPVPPTEDQSLFIAKKETTIKHKVDFASSWKVPIKSI